MEMTTGTDIIQSSTLFDDEALTNIVGWNDAAILLDSVGVPAESMADYGTGFAVVDKSRLIGVDLLLLQWRFNEGDYEKGFVSVEAVTRTNEKVIFNDGSTGIRDQLQTVTAQRLAAGHPHPQAGLTVPGGLTKSAYFYNEDTGERSTKAREGKGWIPASSYYLAS